MVFKPPSPQQAKESPGCTKICNPGEDGQQKGGLSDRPNTTIITQQKSLVNIFLSNINKICVLTKRNLFTLYNLRIAILLRICYFIVTRGDTNVQVNPKGSKKQKKTEINQNQNESA
jgi:hypothetical protein